MSTCVVVLGCYRSGTSCVAGMLHKLGVPMGYDFDPPNANNPRGYWEDLQFKNLHKAMLEGESPEEIYRYRIQSRRLSFPIWGIKDPRLCILLPVLTGLLDDMNVKYKIIECIRSPFDVAKSLEKSAGNKIDWLPYVQEHIKYKTEHLAQYKGEKLELTFDDIFKSDSLDRVAKFVGKEITTEARTWMENSITEKDVSND